MLRPQTWYLLLAAVSILVCLIAGAGTTLQVVLLIVAALAALAVIPLYKNRKLASLTLLPMLALLAWYVVLALYAVPEIMHWQYALPAVAILLIFMARKGIVHDEKVVRSYERIR